ncbi:unnamed protein product [Parascedosporium putredinis]|uniref:Ubiquitin carboxyl-terminal hydrolase n=1 Tax=Parascedosporium putredinis TaxID=1442378 RepID=A0A9P1HAC3_9PEZI|nr:unnamed protein product [Parascedosporium putredinis]CAI8004401.1 unnamed protein product [Parascedosporium putredinis]
MDADKKKKMWVMLAEDADAPDYPGVGPAEPVVWFRQTIGNACGSIGLLHCAVNGPAADFIPCARAVPLRVAERAAMLHDDDGFEAAHKSVEQRGDTVAGPAEEGHAGQHFVAFVKVDGRLWELEGSRAGPLDRGRLARMRMC